ncbi:hypothetical protein [Lactovum miscens]|uniref:Cell division protein FtsL n=1 Tax=Lactovum miscens TaxID=190387 RepID=A0A841C5S3_9LACT|nr:hypothetical protein [Lactovum miscens]MBB5888153.1 cell division protein FtsL [Lactovum miscens]
MADKKSLDISTALQRESFRIRTNTLSPLLRKRFSRLTHLERVFYCMVGITVVILMAATVFVRMKIYEITSTTNEMRIEMNTNQTKIDQYNQNVNDVTSMGKVSAAVTADGFIQASPDNVIRATK